MLLKNTLSSNLNPVDDSTLTVVYTRVDWYSSCLCQRCWLCRCNTGNDVCDTGRAVLVDVDVSDDVPVTSSKVVVAVVVAWLVSPVVPSFVSWWWWTKVS